MNGKPTELADGTTVARLLLELGVPSAGIAVAVNERVVRRGLDGAAPGERHHSGLGRGVVGLAGLRPPAQHRRWWVKLHDPGRDASDRNV